jgi:hypothetical protein
MPLYRVTQTATAYIFAKNVDSAYANFEDVDPGNYVDSSDGIMTATQVATMKNVPKNEDDCGVYGNDTTVQSYFELKSSL